MKKILTLMAFALVAFMANAQILIDGIYYNLDSSTKTATVISVPYGSNKYSGDITIPSSVIYNGNNYSVTCIGCCAFEGCKELKQITIGKNVKEIDYAAFKGCTNLDKVNIVDLASWCEIEFSYEDIDGDYIEGSNPLIYSHKLFLNNELVSDLIIPNGVTKICEKLFSSCTSLTTVSIPNSVTSIGGSAFSGCSSLVSINIPNSVTSIGGSAFSGCSSLVSINIPNSVTSIRGGTFRGCNNLPSIIIPNSVTNIAIDAFYGCSSLITIKVDPANPKYDSRDNSNAIIETSSNTLIIGCKNTVIPNSVTSIGESAFSGCSSLSSVTIPNSITSIGESAFSFCSNLSSIAIGNGVTSIGVRAFYGCTNLTKVHITDIAAWCNVEFDHWYRYLDWVDGEGDEYWDEDFDMTCNPLYYAHDLYLDDKLIKNLVIPEGVEGIKFGSFWSCSSLISVVIPNSMMYIEDRAFEDCTQLFSVFVENPIPIKLYYDEWIDDHHYYGVDSDPFPHRENCALFVPKGSREAYISDYYWKEFKKVVEFEPDNTIINFADDKVKAICVENWDINGDGELSKQEASIVVSIGEDDYAETSPFSNSDITSFEELQYFVGLKYIGWGAFSGCSNLTSIKIPESADIFPYAFEKCTNLNSINIPNNVTSIGMNAFSGCSSLTSITIPNSVTSIDEKAFSGCSSLTSVIIPNSVTYIGLFAFQNCSSLTSITIPNSVTNMEFGPFSGCSSLTSIIVDTGNLYYDSRNNCNAIIETSSNTLILGCKNTVIPNSVTSIGYAAFSGCTGLTSIIIPNSVTSIEDYAFNECDNLSSVNINNNAILSKAYTSSSSLRDIFGEQVTNYVIGDSVKSIGAYAFNNCTNLAAVNISQSVTNIGDCAFSGCSALTSIIIPNNVTNIGDRAFSGCSALTSIIIPNNVTNIGDCAFSGCSALTSIIIPNNVTSIRYGVFSGCSSLTIIDIPTNVTTIGNSAFLDCSSLSSVNIPQSVNNIGDNAFSGCISLPVENNIRYADTYLVEAIDKNQNAYQIKDGTRFIGNEAFQNCTNLALFNIPNTVSSIAVGAFSGCTNLTSVTINSNAFISQSRTQNTSLASIFGNQVEDYVIGNNVTSIGSYAFYKCSGIKSITIPASVTSIGTNAFTNCERLRNVTSLNTVAPSIYSSTFPNRTNQYLYVPKNCKAVYFNADYWWEFKDIIELEEINITFADSNTKSLCVSKWDTNGDGELSESEAAAVTSLGTTFKKSQIASFNELQYFTGLTSISDGAFSKSTVGAITLPENITSIGKEAFLDCKSLTSINIPSKVQTLGQNALSGCTAMTSITVDGDNTAFCSVDDVLFSKDKTTLVQFPAAKATAYDVPEGTKTIGRDAFYVSKLKTVTLPASLEELGFDAFGYSNSLEALEIPEGVTTIGDYILDGCKNVKTLNIPSTVTSIGEHMCNGCNALTDVYCDMTTPLAIAKNNFTTTAYSNATLHVPAFAVDAYRDTEGWKYFQNIVGDMASNILLADAMTINVGKTGYLMVNLSNSTEIDGVQFDITLPAGLDLFVDEEGDYEISTTTRSKKLKANCTRLSNGNYRFILFSTDRAIIAAGEGAIMKIKLACAADAEAGIKEISFSGISLSCVSGNVSVNQYCDDFTTMVTIKKVSDIIGDANGDFAVNITDVMEIVNYILDMTSRTFVFDNADVDHNGVVNITDVMNVVNILLGNAIGYNAPANAKTIPYDLLRISPEDNGCTLHTTFHTQKVTAMQMTVTLPDGCRLESASLAGEASRTHKVMTERINDNRYNIVVFSTNGATLGTDTPILDLGIRGHGGMVNVENIQCSDINLETLLSADISTVITGIGSIIADGDNGNNPVYNTQGQRMNKPQRGINISECRKVVVK